jgi:Flp pilus assembly protein TadB
MDFFSSGTGIIVLVAGGVLEFAGIVIMKKVIDTGS